MISGGPKKDQSLFESGLHSARKRTQHDCLKTARLRTQASLNLEVIAGKKISSGEGSLLRNICAEISQTKIHEVPRPLKLFWLLQSTLLNLTASHVSFPIV